ncbi:hypothetical protein ABC2810 [Shouchella clausii KSM-K16]|uniref:Uncharacterized protein n=1 Tax=Shouchella clausii (strain KSM-K16) TaxID=66692 RepID=Q5WE66_SHOC1|nr:hypothetical protein [Shouchella clausii]BAD65344.1 hypothetical protein ABC2810 [Shouchella clausii KSM-K16]
MNVKGLEQAREEFNEFKGSAVIFMDMQENEAWCDAFEIKDYHSETIVALVGKNDFHSPNDKYRISTLNELAEAKKKMFEQGYDRMDLEDDYHFAEILYYA